MESRQRTPTIASHGPTRRRPGTRSVVFRVIALALLAVALLSTAVEAGPAGRSLSPSARQLAEGLRARRLLGLSTDRDQVRALMSGTGDAGTTTWGIPMTLAEAALVDLPARAAFAERVDRVVFPVLERSASFGGAWIDQQHGGRLVVLLTRHDPPLVRRIGALLGDGRPGYVIGRADRSYRALLAAQAAIASRWVAAPTHAGIDSVGIDAAANALRVRVPADGSTALGVRGPLLATRPSVPLIVETRAAGRDVACTRRDACTPIRPGIVIRRGGRRSTDGCTTGFLITDPRGAALLTSGHCGHVFGTHHRSSQRDWWQPGLRSKVGDTARDDLYDVVGKRGIDVMSIRVADPDAVARRIYGFTPRHYEDPGRPIQGEILCMSLAYSDRRPCGIVSSPAVTWHSETCDCLVVGAALDTIGTFRRGACSVSRRHDGSSTLCPGDSGSPIYRRARTDPPADDRDWTMTPMGIADHEYYPTRGERRSWGRHDVYFAVLRMVQRRWHFSMWAPPGGPEPSAAPSVLPTADPAAVRPGR